MTAIELSTTTLQAILHVGRDIELLRKNEGVSQESVRRVKTKGVEKMLEILDAHRAHHMRETPTNLRGFISGTHVRFRADPMLSPQYMGMELIGEAKLVTEHYVVIGDLREKSRSDGAIIHRSGIVVAVNHEVELFGEPTEEETLANLVLGLDIVD